jgi:hypothetical protein
MRVYAMVTTRASRDYTVAALQSFFTHTPLDASDLVCLIDNDGDWTEGLGLPPFPAGRCEVIRNHAPRSFAANANQAMKIASQRGADLFFLNDDLIFTPGWTAPFCGHPRTVLSPLSNREVQYRLKIEVSPGGACLSDFALRSQMTLAEYLGHEARFAAIAEAHVATAAGILPIFTLPFFCIRIPLAVINEVGAFDESFGVAGGEDFDYCLRAWLCGFEVAFTLSSYLLHFGGRASWAGGESGDARRAREAGFVERFIAKWGEELQKLAFNFDFKVEDKGRGVAAALNNKDFGTVVRTLAGTPLPEARIPLT